MVELFARSKTESQRTVITAESGLQVTQIYSPHGRKRVKDDKERLG